MIEIDQIITQVLEAEDDETIKDILGGQYQEPPPEPPEGSVSRELKNRRTGDYYQSQSRWANVTIGPRQFCISYLTPVAFYDGRDVVRTDKNWSTSTIRHIKAWMDRLGFDTSESWPEVQARFPKTMPQEQLTKLFRDEAMQVKWSKKDAKRLGNLPYDKIRSGLKSDSSDRVEVDPNRQPPRSWE